MSSKLSHTITNGKMYNYVVPASLLCDLSPFQQEFEMANVTSNRNINSNLRK